METIINYAIGILGLILAYYFYRKSIQVKEPVYSVKSTNIISDASSKYEHLRVLYMNSEVKNFTVSKILFFNRGNETITRKDIETLIPLKISVHDCELLDVLILQKNKPSNNFDLSWDASGKAIIIHFDYLDKDQGAVIQMAHTGLSSRDINMTGDIMGVKNLIRLPSHRMKSARQSMLRRAIEIAPLGIMASITTVSLISLAFEESLPVWFRILTGLMSIILLGTFAVFMPSRFGSHFNIPASLEKFDE